MTVSCDLTGRVAVVTGATRGLGAATSRAFARAGARVALLGRTEADLKAQAESIGPAAVPIVTDVADPDDVRRAFARVEADLGRLDVLVNNAASMMHALVSEATDEEIGSMVGTNVMGPMYTTRAAVPLMRRGDGGHILNISTESTAFPEAPYLGLYAATKSALETYSRACFQELKPFGIRVTLLVPGAMEPREAGPVPSGHAAPDERAVRVVQALDASGYLTILRDGGNRAYYEDAVDAMLYAVNAPPSCAFDVIHLRAFPHI